MLVLPLVGIKAQLTIGKNWQLKRIGVYMGEDQDRLSSMDHTAFVNTMRQRPDFDFSNIGVTESYTYSMICENPNLRLNMNFQHQEHSQLELGLSVSGIFDRIDEVVYATPNTYYSDENYQELRFTQIGNEIAIEPTLGFRSQKGAFALTGIIGVNAGYHFGNTLGIYGYNINACEESIRFRNENTSNTDCTTMGDLEAYGSQRNGISARMFAELDASFVIAKRIEMGVMFRRGAGLRFVNQGTTSTTDLHAAGVFMKWVLRD
ncbi:MAG: hypothetical protein Sapg2KO_43600 [Saprospiraceae bacterium]